MESCPHNTLQHTVNTLQHTVTRCNTLQHAAVDDGMQGFRKGAGGGSGGEGQERNNISIPFVFGAEFPYDVHTIDSVCLLCKRALVFNMDSTGVVRCSVSRCIYYWIHWSSQKSPVQEPLCVSLIQVVAPTGWLRLVGSLKS